MWSLVFPVLAACRGFIPVDAVSLNFLICLYDVFHFREPVAKTTAKLVLRDKRLSLPPSS